MLHELGIKYNTDKATRHHFCEAYEKLLTQKVLTLWEIGVFNGGSLNMWADYYPGAIIVGFDIDDKTHLQLLPNVETRLLDQGNIHQLTELAQNNRDIDLIIDDGSHNVGHQIQTFELLFGCLRPGGQYVIEDLHTSTFVHHGYGFSGHNGALQYLNKIIENQTPAGFPGQVKTAEVLPLISSIFIIANCDTRNRRSITSIITRK